MTRFKRSLLKVLLVLVLGGAIVAITFRPRLLETFRCWYEDANPLLAFVVTMVGLAVVYFSAVEWRVRTLVNDPQFVRRLGDEVRRPTLVFDSTNKFLDVQGAALQYIESVRFEPATKEEPPLIVLTSRVHLASPPLLQVLDAFAYDFHPERGEGLGWIYRGKPHPGGWIEGPQSANPRFRLEIIR